MTSDPTAAFLASLAQCGLLDPAQLLDIQTWATQTQADPPALAKELTRRGWLTHYQVKEVYKGRTAELTVGKYQLLDLLGEGGMGRVYKARDTRLGRDVALKVIRKEKLSNPVTAERFRQEIHAAAQVSHPNVVMAFDAEESADGRMFLSMEYVEGTDLTKLVRQRGPMPIPVACDAIRQAAIGLQHAYERGMVHRDVKPSNLLYTPKGQVKVLDLGLALLNVEPLPGGENANRVTQEGYVLGTPDFLAPEQAQNPTAVDIRADIYALGSTLFYLLTGRVPYDGATPTEKLLKHITNPPPELQPLRPDAPPQLAAVIKWFMAKRPDARPQTPAQAALALAPFCPGQSGTVPAAAAMMPQAAPQPVAVAGPENPFGDMNPNLDFGERSGRDAGRVRVKAPVRRGGNFVLVLLGIGAFLGLVCLGVGTYFGLVVLPEAAERSRPLEAEFVNDAGQSMVLIEAGSFKMGSPDGEAGREDNEGPLTDVTLSQKFYMSATEVNRKQYTEVMKGPPPARTQGVSDKVGQFMPAAGVSWDLANEYCKKLNVIEGKRRKGWAYRLPTEAEWEYCARAGSDGPFSTGGRILYEKQAVFKLEEGDPYQDTKVSEKAIVVRDMPLPTATKDAAFDGDLCREANKFGLFDLHGNLWEWCSDYYDEKHPGGTVTDPTGPASALGNWHVLKGGAWDLPAAGCRSASRKGMAPAPDSKKTLEYANVGFRVVYAPVPEVKK